MKVKKVEKKLILNKSTIADLSSKDMHNLKAGEFTPYCSLALHSECISFCGSIEPCHSVHLPCYTAEIPCNTNITCENC